MRLQLSRFKNKTVQVTAIVDRFGYLPLRGRRCPTVMFHEIKLQNGDVIADHNWFKCGSWSRNLKKGDIVCFTAKVIFKHNDHRLVYPQNVKVVDHIKRYRSH